MLPAYAASGSSIRRLNSAISPPASSRSAELLGWRRSCRGALELSPPVSFFRLELAGSSWTHQSDSRRQVDGGVSKSCSSCLLKVLRLVAIFLGGKLNQQLQTPKARPRAQRSLRAKAAPGARQCRTTKRRPAMPTDRARVLGRPIPLLV